MLWMAPKFAQWSRPGNRPIPGLRDYGTGIYILKRTSIALLCALLAGCQNLPGDGPLTEDILKQAELSRTGTAKRNSVLFDVVDVDASSARLISNYESMLLQKRFGIGGSVQQPLIGVGDALRITIFEAGSDGLFSTADSKQTVVEVVVQPDGMAAIPYVGQIVFQGKTLEQARRSILDALTGKAVEPDVIVSSTSTASRNVSVSGAVGNASVVPLSLRGETIMEVLAKAGGPTGQPYENYVTLVRGQRSGTVLLKSLIDSPRENIYVQSGDQLFITRDPRTFTILGAVNANGRIEFGSNDLNLLEAVALAQGSSKTTLDMKGYFIFRYEEPDIVHDLLGPERFRRLIANGMQADKVGRYPIVYRFNMGSPDSMMVGQTFPVKNRDVIYGSRHPSVDFIKFVDIVGRPIGIVSSAAAVSNNFTD